MTVLGQTLVLYAIVGVAIAVTMYLQDRSRHAAERWYRITTSVVFWPLYLPLLLADKSGTNQVGEARQTEPPPDEMASAIAQVDSELEGALRSLDGWAEDVLAREADRLHELRTVWSSQAERIRGMDQVLTQETAWTRTSGSERAGDNPRLRASEEARKLNVERLRQVRQRTHQDLMGTLGWVRELVSMIHLAKFTGAPASRAEELIAQIAAAVEGLSELTWQEHDTSRTAMDTTREGSQLSQAPDTFKPIRKLAPPCRT